MFILNLLCFIIHITFAGIALSILYYLIIFTLKFVNVIKKLIVWAFRDKIAQLTLYPSEKRYRRDVVETGYSMSYSSAPVYHYRYKTVFDGTYRNVIVRFSNNLKLKISIKEESLLYQKLLSI